MLLSPRELSEQMPAVERLLNLGVDGGGPKCTTEHGMVGALQGATRLRGTVA